MWPSQGLGNVHALCHSALLLEARPASKGTDRRGRWMSFHNSLCKVGAAVILAVWLKPSVSPGGGAVVSPSTKGLLGAVPHREPCCFCRMTVC